MSENKIENTESVARNSTEDKHELELMENEIFRKYWQSLNAALAEIKELRGSDSPEIDPVEFVKHEVSTLKDQFSELKQMIAALQQQQQQQSQQQPVSHRFQQMQPTVPILPYYQTPNFAPIVPITQ